MQAKSLISAALFSALSTAQINNIDTVAVARAATEQANFYSSLVTNTEFKSDFVAVASAIPYSAVDQADSNPASFANALQTGTATPAWVSAIPTPVLNSLNNLLAKPNKAEDDAIAIATGPQASAIFANPAIPTSVQGAFTRDPISFIEDLLTATTWPASPTSIPGPLQTQVGQVINQELSTFIADYESTYASASATRSGTGTGASYSYRPTSSGVAAPTSGRPFFPTASGNACPTCSSCSPVTVIVTVSASSQRTGTTAPAVPSTPSGGFPGSSRASSPAFPTTFTTSRGTASSGVVAFTGARNGSALAFTGAAAPMRTAAVGAAMLVAGAGAFLNV